MSTAPETRVRDEAASAASSHVAEPAPGWALPLLACLFVAGLALRLLVGLRSGVWRDEAQMLFIVDEPSWASMFDALRLHESHPPLFYVVMRGWLAVAGDGDTAALAVPIALGAAVVPALYLVGRRLLSWRAGLLAAAAAAFSPNLVSDTALARPYSLLPLLALGATYALVRAVDLGGARRWAAYAAAALALVYTHNWAWLVLAAQSVAVVACLWRGVPRARWSVVRGWAGALGAIALGFLPWLPSFLHQSAHAGYGPLHVFGHGALQTVGVVLRLPQLVVESTVALTGAGALAAAVVLWALAVSAAGIVVGRRRHGDGPPDAPGPPAPRRSALTVVAVTPLVASLAAFGLSVRTNLLTPYCLGMLTPLLLLLVATGLDRWRAAGQPRLAAVGAAALLAAYAATLPPLVQEPRSDARELARAVASAADPGDLVVIAPWWFASPFNRYYTAPTEQIDFPAAGRVGAIAYDDEVRRLSDPQALAATERRLTQARAAGRRVWFVTEGEPTACHDAACEAKVLASRNFVPVGGMRAGQLREYLEHLYGAPVRCETGGSGARLENLTACLFGVR